MSGFSFGAKTTAPPAFGTGTVSFGGGTPQSQPTMGTGTGFQFGSNTLGATSTSSLFGTTTAAPKPAFAMPAATGLGNTPSGGLFGAQPQIAAVAPTGGFGFGAPASTAASAGGFGFTTATTSAPPAFGNPTSTAPPAFGAQTSTAPTSLSFAPQPSSGLSFGAPQTSAAPVGLGFGAQASTASSGLGFGTQASTAPSGLGFGAQASTAPSGLTFGAVSTSAPTLGLNFGATGTAAPTVGFGATTTSTASGSLGFGLGTTTTASGLSFGLGGTPVTSNNTQFSLTSAPAPSTGLGGIASTQAKTTVTTQKEIPPKDQPLPNEIMQTVEQFKEMLKEQKAHCSDIARCSVREFRKVEQEIDSLNNLINDVEIQLQKNRLLAEKLKYDAAKSLQNVEMAQRTHDTPPGLQYENTAPLRYFLDLADNFERQMQTIKAQIECADKYVKSSKSPESLSPQDLSTGMRHLHDTFVALAGRLQSVHSQVEAQKESYVNIRKHLLNDHSDPFEKLYKSEDQINMRTANLSFYSPPKIACGPTPFGHLALGGLNSVLQHHNSPPPAYPGTSGTNQPTAQAFGGPSPFGTQVGSQPSNTSLFGSTSFNSSFQLQKPPTGNKRGKV